VALGVDMDILPERYRQPVRIGHGAMGDIFRAHDTALERDVAVKVLAERYCGDEEIRERFMREALTAAGLSSEPGIVTIYDVGEWNGRPFIVMEYMPGGSVADRLRARRPDDATALMWLEEAAVALDAGHRRGVVHRDVKPGNLLLDAEGHVHVADFGIASAPGRHTLTLTGTVLGTAGYLPPEQALGDRAGPAADRYALGVVAWELLAGRRPFANESTTAEAAAHVNSAPPSLCEHRGDLPCHDLDKVFVRVLAKEPAARPSSCAELVAELRQALEAGPRPAAAPLPRRPGRSAVRWLALGAIMLGALAGGITLAAALGDDEERAAPPEPRLTTRVTTVEVTAPGTTVRQQVTVTAPSPTTSEEPPATTTSVAAPSGASGVELTDQATALLQAGRYEEAAATARQALAVLGGSGELYEAYALYDLGAALAALGQCEEAVEVLRRSEQIQGPREEIATARARCR
jgi:serine/threonine-protein kinase